MFGVDRQETNLQIREYRISFLANFIYSYTLGYLSAPKCSNVLVTPHHAPNQVLSQHRFTLLLSLLLPDLSPLLGW